MILAVLVFGSTTGYHYEAGYEHHYTYSSTTDTIGMHNITTVMKVWIQSLKIYSPVAFFAYIGVLKSTVYIRYMNSTFATLKSV